MLSTQYQLIVKPYTEPLCLTGVLNLVGKIIEQVHDDMRRSDKLGVDAREFFNSRDYNLLCLSAGLSPSYMRRKALESAK